jgi:hypothetical protein
VPTQPGLYLIRIRGRLGATARSAFPSMVSELKHSETVLTGLLEDQSALFGVLAQIEALGLELLELRQLNRRDLATPPHLPGGNDGSAPPPGALPYEPRPKGDPP